MALNYHQKEDVEALLRATGQQGVDFSKGVPIPEADIIAHMEDTETRVDLQLKAIYTVPITDEEGVRMLKFICARFTAATVWRIAHGRTIQGPSQKAQEWEEEAQRYMDMILSGQIIIGDPITGASKVKKVDYENQFSVGESEW